MHEYYVYIFSHMYIHRSRLCFFKGCCSPLRCSLSCPFFPISFFPTIICIFSSLVDIPFPACPFPSLFLQFLVSGRSCRTVEGAGTRRGIMDSLSSATSIPSWPSPASASSASSSSSTPSRWSWLPWARWLCESEEQLSWPSSSQPGGRQGRRIVQEEREKREGKRGERIME